MSSITPYKPTKEERRYLLRIAGNELARLELAERHATVTLLTPAEVEAALRCDVRTLEARGLQRVELSPRVVRYRLSDVEELLNHLTK